MNVKSTIYYLCFIGSFAYGILSFFYLSYNVYLQLLGISSGLITGTAIFFTAIQSLPSFQKKIAPILGAFSFLEKAQLASIAYNIQGNINEFREIVNEETPGLTLIPEAEVDWVTKTDRESFFDEYKGKVIIRMEPSKENARNLAKAVMIQVSKGVIPQSRIYIEQKTSRSIDLTLAKKILTKQNQQGALTYFTNEELNPSLGDKDILSLVECLDAVDERGFLTRLYLRELTELPKKHGLKLRGLSEIRDETSNLLNFLKEIVTRGKGEKVPLAFEGKYLRTAIILVSEEQKFEREGIAPYVLAALTHAKKGFDFVYVVACGNKITNAFEVINYLQDQFKMESVKGTLKPFNILLGDKERIAVCAMLKTGR